ncbi:UDP-N-acetylglucosamine 2-epimerase [Clostridiaceae bacterium BL-3]|nr:UDP-N-acetylglucosamine 2-epimerase [Clostridiaceae bacterium BL-3]
MKNIGIVTTSRADFGLLYPIINVLDNSDYFRVKVIATGMHLLKEYGYTLKYVKDKCRDVDKIDLFMPVIDKCALVKSIGIGFMSFADYFVNNNFDAIMVLGDRCELIVPVYSAMIYDIPIIHVFGGDSIESYVTYDNNIRHCITKLANIHFTATKEHAIRIKKLGEEDWRIFNVGSPAIDYISSCNYLSKDELQNKFNKINFCNQYCVLTYHPVPTEIEYIGKQIDAMIQALNLADIQIICTKPNNDLGNEIILDRIKREDSVNSKFLLVDSVSQEEYYSLLKYSTFMIGNTSSGILESSAFNIPSINIGSRQLGRIKGKNVIDVTCYVDDIIKAVKKCREDDNFRTICKTCENPYGDGTAGFKILKILKKLLSMDKKKLLIKKNTY